MPVMSTKKTISNPVILYSNTVLEFSSSTIEVHSRVIAQTTSESRKRISKNRITKLMRNKRYPISGIISNIRDVSIHCWIYFGIDARLSV